MTNSGLPTAGVEEPSLPRFSLRTLLVIFVLLGLGLTLVVKSPVILRWAYRTWQVGEQFDQREFPGATFSCRITAFHERGMVLAAPGAFYRYEVKNSSNSDWRTIATIRGSRPDLIADNRMTHVTNMCTYFYHEQVYGVTIDGGVTWSIKGGSNYPPIVNGRNESVIIESAAVNPDGSGEMTLSTFENQDWVRGQGFITSDFGQTWTNKEHTE